MSEAHCAVCGKVVATQDQDAHLKTNHLGPHCFWFDARKYQLQRLTAELAKVEGVMPQPAKLDHPKR